MSQHDRANVLYASVFPMSGMGFIEKLRLCAHNTQAAPIVQPIHTWNTEHGSGIPGVSQHDYLSMIGDDSDVFMLSPSHYSQEQIPTQSIYHQQTPPILTTQKKHVTSNKEKDLIENLAKHIVEGVSSHEKTREFEMMIRSMVFEFTSKSEVGDTVMSMTKTQLSYFYGVVDGKVTKMTNILTKDTDTWARMTCVIKSADSRRLEKPKTIVTQETLKKNSLRLLLLSALKLFNIESIAWSETSESNEDTGTRIILKVEEITGIYEKCIRVMEMCNEHISKPK